MRVLIALAFLGSVSVFADGEPFNFDNGYQTFSNVQWVYNTPHFSVYYDTTTVSEQLGTSMAQAMRGSLEKDYSKLKSYFGWDAEGTDGTAYRTHENPDGTRLNIILYLATPGGGTGHISTGDTVMNLALRKAPHDSAAQMEVTYADEVTQLFYEKIPSMSAGDLGNAWDDGLSLALSDDLHPDVRGNSHFSYIWLNSDRQDFVNNNPVAVDGANWNYSAISCGKLYWFWLRYRQGYSWKDIMTATKASANLADVYHRLAATTSDAFSPFVEDVDSLLPASEQYPESSSDNPFHRYSGD